MDKEKIISILKKENVIFGSNPEFKPLKGGVSSDIYLIKNGDQKYVLKQALQKLRVEDDWFADISRNINEQKFIRFLKSIRPDAVPKLLYRNEEEHFFVMEFLDDEFKNWKQQLLAGIFEKQTAIKSAELLADIHLQSLGNLAIKKEFNHAENFHSLRTDPYLGTTGERNPKLKDLFFAEAERLKTHQETLVHGDFSPKNIMVKEDKVVLLDHEVAWFGDPAFDLAFFLNHLYLKMLFWIKKTGKIQDLTHTVWATYFDRLGEQILQKMEQRTIRLLLMMMLARIDGKSPVEYLGKDQQEFVRSFVKMHLSAGQFSHSVINQKWKDELKNRFGEDKRD